MLVYDPNWTIANLRDLQKFFAENGMEKSASALEDAIQVAELEIATPLAKYPWHVSLPVH